MDEGEEEAARNRFAHLLNPIKDLAENWTINIAQELQDYLGELNLIKFKIGGMSGLNFTEAALLIQGAVGIYSKKVEYLFHLVVRSLAAITENKEKSKQASSINPETGEDADMAQYEDQVELLPLDGLKENADINMVETNERETDSALNLRPLDNFMLSSMAQSTDLNAKEGELTDQSKNHFRMNRAAVGLNGMLLLGDTADALKANANPPSPVRRGDKTLMREREAPAPSSTLMSEKEASLGITDLASLPMFQNNEQYLNLDNLNLGASNALMSNEMQTITANERASSGLLGGASMFAAGAGEDSEDEETEPRLAGQANERPRRSGRARGEANELTAEQVCDAWAHWDPHDDAGIVAKPFKKGTTFTIPKVAKEGASEKPASASTRASAAILRPAYAEFQYIFDLEMKMRTERQRQAKKALQQQNRPDVPRVRREREVNFDGAGYDSEDDERLLQTIQAGGATGFDPYGDQDSEEGYGHVGGVADQLEDMGVGAMLNDADLMRARLTQDVNMFDTEAAVPSQEMSYEQLCRMHFEQSVKVADLYMQQWDQQLGTRIASWKARLLPLLEIQESRVTYSVKLDVTKILSTFPRTVNKPNPKVNQKEAESDGHQGLGAVMSFNAIVEGQKNWEVSRSFVTMLHMINAGNLAIEATRDMRGGNDKISFTLLSRSLVDLENSDMQLELGPGTASDKVKGKGKARGKKNGKNAKTPNSNDNEMESEASAHEDESSEEEERPAKATTKKKAATAASKKATSARGKKSEEPTANGRKARASKTAAKYTQDNSSEEASTEAESAEESYGESTTVASTTAKRKNNKTLPKSVSKGSPSQRGKGRGKAKGKA